MKTLYIFDARHIKDGVIEISDYRLVDDTVFIGTMVYRLGHSIFETWEEAAAKAYRARDKKCDALKAQIKELMAIDFSKRNNDD